MCPSSSTNSEAGERKEKGDRAVYAPRRFRTGRWAAVERWAAAILKGAPLSIRASKQAVMRGLDEPSLAAALANQARYPAFGTWFNSADAAEGPRAFAEKRAPEWQGR